MQDHLNAIFDNRPDADAAMAALQAAGFARSALYLSVGDPTGADSPITGNGNPDAGGKVSGNSGDHAGGHIERGGVGNFLHSLFGTDNSKFVQSIDGAVTHSHLVLTVQVDDAVQSGQATAILRRHRPARIDLDEASAASWRRHHAASAGGVAEGKDSSEDHYSEYAPAYLYGVDMATHEQHGGQEWQDAEPALQQEWERRHPASPWQRFRAAVRHSWDSLKGRGKNKA